MPWEQEANGGGRTLAVSVVIPARNAAGTIRTTIASLLAQTYPDWEAIVVDNGSDDGTADVVADTAAGDPRIRVVAEPRPGVGAARNRGLAEAREELVLFLDADDYLEPLAFERVVALLRERPDLDGVRYDWAIESPDGRRGAMSAWGLGDEGEHFFAKVAHSCPLAIHACILRRRVLAEVGGFDESLIAAEDWDLWQRIARTAPKIGFVPETLAYYVQHAGSATHRDFGRVLGDSLRVVARIHAPDPRVTRPAPDYADGAPPSNEFFARRQVFLWAFGLAIGAGGDVQSVLGAFPNPGRGSIDPADAAQVLHFNVPVGAGLTWEQWDAAWPRLAAPLERGLTALAAWDGDPALADRIWRRLEARILVEARGALDRVGTTACTTVELERPIEGWVSGADGATRLVVLARVGGAYAGAVELPVIAGAVPAATIRQAVVDQLGATAARSVARRPAMVPRLTLGAAKSLTDARTWRALGALRRPLYGRRWEAKRLAKSMAAEALRRAPIARPSDPHGAARPTDELRGRRAPATPRRAPRGVSAQVTRRLPILMYHRVAPDGPAPLDRFRVTPEQFAEHLALLRRNGFESVSLDEWGETLRSGRPLPGRRVVLSFDDGYRDFREHAVPALREFGYSATVFVIPDLVGRASIWDADLGEPAPLMDWDELRDIRTAGIDIGSHTLDHRHLTALTPDAVLARERRARATIAERLDAPAPTVVAYPYGDVDHPQRLTMWQAGYRVGVTTRYGVSDHFEHPMDLSRLEVRIDHTVADVAQLVGIDP